MEIVYLLLPASILLAIVAVAGYIWASKSGQFDDLDTPAHRMLSDENSNSVSKKKLKE